MLWLRPRRALLLVPALILVFVAEVALASHDACRGRDRLGGGLDPATGLYDWTCATEHTDWHGSVDPTQSDASYLVTCIGPGTPHPTCLGAEARMIGAVHEIGMAAARTRPGGTVYVPNFEGKPYAIWVDDGCGTLSDGETPAKCPPAYSARWRDLPHFDRSGPHIRGDRVQAHRGVRIVAENSPTVEEDAAQPRILTGGWLVADTGNSIPRAGPGGFRLDGPDRDLPLDAFRFITGGAKWERYCLNEDNSSIACNRKGPEGLQNQWSGEDSWLSGVASSVHTNHRAGDASICLDNGITHRQSTTLGTCRGDRRYRCWDANRNGDTREDRNDGSCIWKEASPPVDLGPCDGFVDALQIDHSESDDLRLVFQLSQCTQPASSPSDCSALHGHSSYLTEIESVPADACGATGKTVQLSDSGQPAPVPDFAAGGSPNRVFVTSAELYDQDGGGFYNFGFMPGNFFKQVHAGDVRFVGSTSSAGDTQILSVPGASWVPGEWGGYTAVIDPLGLRNGPMYQTIASNSSSTLTLTMSTNDTNCTNGPCTESQNAGLVEEGDTVEIRGGMCSGSFHGADKGQSDETVCDHTMLTGNFSGKGAGFYGSLHYLCSSPAGGPSCADSNSLNVGTGRYWDGRIFEARRGFISDLSGDHMKNYRFESGEGTVFLSNFSSYGRHENLSFVDNEYRHLIFLAGQHVIGARFNGVFLSGNRGGGTSEILIGTVTDLWIENVVSLGGERSTFMIVRPRTWSGSPESSDLRDIVFKNLFAMGELGRRFGDNGPSAGIFIDVSAATNDTESIDGLTIDEATFIGTGPAQCGVWLEDDHETPGASTMEESRETMVFRNVSAASSSGLALAVCSGISDGYPHDDATNSEDTFAQDYVPTIENTLPCSDGIDNDGNGLIDYDGGYSAGLAPAARTAPDPHCRNDPRRRCEAEECAGACGLGAELVWVLPALVGLRTLVRRRRSAVRS